MFALLIVVTVMLLLESGAARLKTHAGAPGVSADDETADTTDRHGQ